MISRRAPGAPRQGAGPSGAACRAGASSDSDSYRSSRALHMGDTDGHALDGVSATSIGAIRCGHGPSGRASPHL